MVELLIFFLQRHLFLFNQFSKSHQTSVVTNNTFKQETAQYYSNKFHIDFYQNPKPSVNEDGTLCGSA